MARAQKLASQQNSQAKAEFFNETKSDEIQIKTYHDVIDHSKYYEKKLGITGVSKIISEATNFFNYEKVSVLPKAKKWERLNNAKTNFGISRIPDNLEFPVCPIVLSGIRRKAIDLITKDKSNQLPADSPRLDDLTLFFRACIDKVSQPKK